MTAYIIRRLLFIVPTLFGIMVINFAVVQFAPGGPVEQIIAQVTGNAVDATARISGAGGGDAPQSQAQQGAASTTGVESRYRGAQGLDPQFIADLRAQAEAVVLESAVETGSSSIADFYNDRLAVFFAAPRNMWLHLQGSRRATFARMTDMDIMTRYLDDQEMVYADKLRGLVERKDRLDYAYALQTVLKAWLFVHIPATYGLILLALLHLLLAYSFGGAR